MSNIKVMQPDLANKIAAGEVIENQASVVKELVENSIDAAATKVDITLLDSGFQLIQVVDDGHGMAKDDIVLSLTPHATSKIYDHYDLFRIKSLGFRGEALPSVASVAKVYVATNDGSGPGYIYDVVDAEMKKGYQKKGTNIAVYNLFYNVPARLKYLQSQKSELANITNTISRLALMYPNIAFTLTNDGKTLVKTNGSSDLLQVISQVYSLDTAQNMEAIANKNSDFKIEGYIANRFATRSNKRSINIFVNKRLVYNKDLEQAIIKGYGDYLMERRYPVVVLNIECDYQLIDVNVHPAKLEVRISKQEELSALIVTSIQEVFNVKQQEFISKPPEVQPAMTFTYKTPIISDNTIKYPNSITKEKQINSESVHQEDIEIAKETEKQPDIPVRTTTIQFNVIGQFDATYILAQNEKGLHLIDQHAAMERINYEKQLQRVTQEKMEYQDLIVPIIIPLTLSEKMKVLELKRQLALIGLIIEEQANNDLTVRQIPLWLDLKNANEYVELTIDYVLSLNNVRIKDIKKEDLVMASCKMSLKANHYLSVTEQQALLNQLITTPNYDHCPHGRPIIVSFTRTDLEKMFKRII